MNDLTTNIAAQSIERSLDASDTLENRIRHAMQIAKDPKKEHEIFWMHGHLTDETRLRAALSAVNLKATEDEQEILKRSFKALQMVNLILSGVPVDIPEPNKDEPVLPLMDFWHNEDLSPKK